MDKRKQLCKKSIQVIWKRDDGCNNRESYCLPELKEIDLEDSVKKPAKIDSSLHSAQMNKKNKERALHKRVRKSLFPDEKIGKLNKSVGVDKSKDKHFVEPRKSSPLKSPQIMSKQEKIRQNLSTSAVELNQFSFQTEKISKTAELLLSNTVCDPSIIKSSVMEVDKIVPHASHPKLLDVSNKKTNYDNKNSSKINLSSDQNIILNSDKNKLVEFQYDITCAKKISNNNNLSEAFQVLSCSKSPEIVSRRKRYYEHNGSLDKTNLLKRDDVNVTTNIPNESRDPLISSRKISDSLTKTSQICVCLSPIISSRKKMKSDPEDSFCESKLYPSGTAKILKTESSPQFSVHDISVIKSSNSNKNKKVLCASDLGPTKSPEIMSTAKKFNLNKANKSNNDELNVTAISSKKLFTNFCNHVATSLKNKCDDLSKALQTSFCSEQSQIVSNKKKTKTNKDTWFPNSKRCLLQSLENSKAVELLQSRSSNSKLIVNASNITQNHIKPREEYLLSNHKSPEITANQKLHIDNIFLDKFNVSQLDNSVVKTNELLPSCSANNEMVVNAPNTAKNHVRPREEYFLSNHKSPEIATNQKLHIKNNILDKFNVVENSVVETKELLQLHSANDELAVNTPNTTQNQIRKHEFCGHKSPEIISKQKFRNKNNKFYKTEISEFDKSNANRLTKKCCELDNIVSSPRKKSFSLSKASQLLPYSRVPQIVPNREKMNALQDTRFPKSKRCLFQIVKSTKTAEILPPSTVRVPSVGPSNLVEDKIKLRTDHEIVNFKSPEINSNKKHDCFEFSLEKTNVPNYDNCNENKFKLESQVSTNSHIKSENNVNIHSSNVPLKSNYVHSEDIVESSEIFCQKKTKQMSENHKIHRKKKPKLKCIDKKQNDRSFVDLPVINVQENGFKNKTEISETNKNKLCSESVNSNYTDIINTENIVKSPFITLKIKKSRKKFKKSIIKLRDNQRFVATESKSNDLQISDTKKLINNNVEDDLITSKPHKKECLNEDKNKKNVKFHITSPEISVIPATPERNAVDAKKPVIENFSETLTNVSIPLIEVDQSPKTPPGKNQRLALIQSIHSPQNEELLPPGFFESVDSPALCPSNTQKNVGLPFKIDSILSPASAVPNDSLFSPEPYRKKLSENSPSPNHFDSAKKRKKVCKDGLRGKFLELVSRKKSEACIREYEKTLSKNYQPKQEDETVLLNVIELWKEFNTFVLLCYRMISETEVQKVLVTLDACPKNVIKHSIIRIYSPWSIIKSKTIDLLMYVGVVHTEVIECPGPSRILEPTELFPNFNGLLTTTYQSEVLWKCNCSEDAACECLGESSVYNYLQYMVSDQDV